MNSSHSMSDADNSASTGSPKITREVSLPKETTAISAEEAKKRRAQRRRNRKKLVPLEESKKGDPEKNKPEVQNTSDLILKPSSLLSPVTVTFKEAEIRPISEGKIFVQREHDFIPVSQDIFFLSSTQNLLESNPISSSPESVALEYQKRFVPFATFCHGLLAGMALWQSIMVYQLKDYESFTSAEDGYINTARAFQTIFYILVAVSSVAVMDWCIPNNKNTWDDFRKHLALQPLSLFALMASAASIVTWALTAQLDDIKASKFQNGTSVAASKENFVELQEQWVTLNLVRCVFAGIGFFLTAVSQNFSQGSESVKKL